LSFAAGYSRKLSKTDLGVDQTFNVYVNCSDASPRESATNALHPMMGNPTQQPVRESPAAPLTHAFLDSGCGISGASRSGCLPESIRLVSNVTGLLYIDGD
jgi:hypothetical protein